MTRWHSDALAAPHTQRELDEIPQRKTGLSYDISAYSYTKADINRTRRDALQDASDVDMILAALRDVHDADVSLRDYAQAVSKAISGMK